MAARPLLRSHRHPDPQAGVARRAKPQTNGRRLRPAPCAGNSNTVSWSTASVPSSSNRVRLLSPAGPLSRRRPLPFSGKRAALRDACATPGAKAGPDCLCLTRATGRRSTRARCLHGEGGTGDEFGAFPVGVQNVGRSLYLRRVPLLRGVRTRPSRATCPRRNGRRTSRGRRRSGAWAGTTLLPRDLSPREAGSRKPGEDQPVCTQNVLQIAGTRKVLSIG